MFESPCKDDTPISFAADFVLFQILSERIFAKNSCAFGVKSYTLKFHKNIHSCRTVEDDNRFLYMCMRFRCV